MAVPSNTAQTYALKGIREDLSDVIYNVAPDQTPFLSRCKKVKASNTYHEWQTDTLRSSAVNAHIEGDDTTANAITATVRLGNYTQIFKNAVVVSRTADAVNKAGRETEMGAQIVKVMKEHKLDIEKALFDNQARVAGDASTARRLAGAPAWIKTNFAMASAGSPANPAGDGTNARTDGTAIAFTQARFDSVMQQAWVSGGRPDTVYLSAFQLNVARGFTGNNGQQNTVKQGEVASLIDVYVTPWGRVQFVPARENRPRDVLLIQSDMWAVAQLDPTKNTELAKTGDNTKRQIVTELTLEARNEKASGIVADNTTS